MRSIVAVVITATAGFFAIWILTSIAWFLGTVPTIATLVVGPGLVGFLAGALTRDRYALIAGLVGLMAGALVVLAPFFDFVLVFGGIAAVMFLAGFALARRRASRTRSVVAAAPTGDD